MCCDVVIKNPCDKIITGYTSRDGGRMKNTRALNLLIEEGQLDKNMIARKAQVPKEKLEMDTCMAYDAGEFLEVCEVCNIKPEVVFRMVKEDK